jgi:hypothetical protein
MTANEPIETPGVKVMYLIRRRATTTREELIAHWFANHMPPVIARNRDNKTAGKLGADRYLVTLFDPRAEKPHTWDGVAQLWYSKPLPRPAQPHGTDPTDTFQEKAEPYMPWAAREFVVMDGDLPYDLPTLDRPFPCTRSGFFKVTFLVPQRPGTEIAAMYRNWLDVHAPNVRETMEAVGGFRYVINHSLEPEREDYAGMAELYFPTSSEWDAYRDRFRADGFENWVDPGKMKIFYSGTEMVGID